MKTVVIIQVIIMKCTFGMSRKRTVLSTGGNMMTAGCTREPKITRAG